MYYNECEYNFDEGQLNVDVLVPIQEVNELREGLLNLFIQGHLKLHGPFGLALHLVLVLLHSFLGWLLILLLFHCRDHVLHCAIGAGMHSLSVETDGLLHLVLTVLLR